MLEAPRRTPEQSNSDLKYVINFNMNSIFCVDGTQKKSSKLVQVPRRSKNKAHNWTQEQSSELVETPRRMQKYSPELLQEPRRTQELSSELVT
ncbi:hypothetical protein CEXT_630671 [Caerostris extrusa]|uniref:Uncharacterized protein n=1 Tax=Caerostris extrusa TaxID=172846 RepID=A0AAV4WLW9_CAEEX|nr:hypothetical protein CEXT_630671 [Caerostris extrusa]